jgi:hypothetical protein
MAVLFYHRRQLLLIFVISLLKSLTKSQEQQPSSSNQKKIDLETEPAYFVAVPVAIKVAQIAFGERASDITLILRLTTLLNMAWFDALAAYHPTAKGR